jgi:aminoglycoside phosphotransferase (APT) family kinase protein
VPFDPENARSISLATEAALIQATGANGARVPQVRHVCDEPTAWARPMSWSASAARPWAARSPATRASTRAPGAGAPVRRGAGRDPRHAAGRAEPEDRRRRDRARPLRGDLPRHGAERPILELAFQYLRSTSPDAVEPVLLHGDFRNGNIMFDPEIGVAAVLDWELAHVGDPAEDMGWICTNSWRFGRPDRPVGGFGEYADLLAGYASAGGRPIELRRVRFWQMLGSLRWGIMCLSMYLSWRDG